MSRDPRRLTKVSLSERARQARHNMAAPPPVQKQEAARLLSDEVRAPAERNVPPAEIGLINRTFYIMITV